MKNILFVEFVDHVPMLVKNHEEKDIIVALSPDVASELDYKRIPYKKLQGDYYSHKEYMKIVPYLEHQLNEIINKLDEEIINFEDCDRPSGLMPFLCFIYFHKFMLDSIRVKIFELTKLFSKEKIKNVKIFKSFPERFSEFYEFSTNESIYNALIMKMMRIFGFSVQILEAETKKICAKRIGRGRGWPYIKKIAASTFRGIFGQSSKKGKYGTILSVDCRELNYIKQFLSSNGWEIEYTRSTNFKSCKDTMRTNNVINKLFENKNTINLFVFMNLNYFFLIKDRLEFFCKNLGNIYSTYEKLKKYVVDKGFNVVFFHSHSPLNFESVLLPLICKKNRIPYVCWMHGGAGNNKILYSYKYSDLLFGQHYFVYGESYNKLIKKSYSHKKLIPYTVGSPMLAATYIDYEVPKNKKKIVTIVTGPCGNKNIHHLFDSPHYRFDYYMPLKKVLDIVKKYTNKYRILIRSHNNASQHTVLKNLLKTVKAEKIEIIHTEMIEFEKIVKSTDMFINFWISTTFYEECLSKADIFLFDDSDLTDETKNIIFNRAFWFDDLGKFSTSLEEYLNKGNFYQKGEDDTFINQYLNWENKDSIAQKTLNIIKKIAK